MMAMILAAGVGSRLSPLTLFMPKPMVPVCNKPVMEHIIDLLAQHQVKTVVANLHYLPDQIERHFGNGQRWGVNLTYSLERSLLGTAGAVKRVADIFDETFLVLMGDAISDLDLTAMLAFHRGSQSKVTIALHEVADPSRFGVAQVDGHGRIQRFQEKPEPGTQVSNLASMGFYILEPDILDLIPAGTVYDFGRELFPLLLDKGVPFYGYRSNCYWSDVGSFGEYRAAQGAMLNGRLRTALLPGRKVAPGLWQGRNVVIHPKARITAPALIGDNCQVGADAEIGPNAVLGNNVIVAEGATVSGSVVLDGTYVGRLVNVQDAVVNRNCLVNVPSNTSVFVSDNFLLGEVGEDVVLRGVARTMEWLAGFALAVASLPLFLIAFVAALFAGSGTLIERVALATNDPRTLRESARLGWRAVTLHRFRADLSTALGRWLDRTGLRDLPGLIAVLKGDLALVGVGPLTPDQAGELTDEWQQQRFHAPAGLIGLWYLNGAAQPGGKLPLDEQLIVDSYYAVTRTWKEDMRIILKTPGALLRRLFQSRARPGRRATGAHAISTDAIGTHAAAG
jgi:NDP-sugar pyrophosphorylase family protein/lipopolysaccharide/colanic/teichoic acid biosynthesis glycosyltransferase